MITIDDDMIKAIENDHWSFRLKFVLETDRWRASLLNFMDNEMRYGNGDTAEEAFAALMDDDGGGGRDFIDSEIECMKYSADGDA